ncbi:MAG: hypothetical protein ACNA8R_09860 [Nitriliruptoraceae bacterium]
MIPARRRLVRLTLLPVLLVAAVLATVAVIADLAPDREPPAVELALPPVVELDMAGCARDHDGSGLLDRPVETAGRRVTSELVVSCPSRFDGRRVTYVGEVVGDLLRREGGAWVLVNDDDYALEVGPLPGHRDRRGTNSGMTVWLPDPLPEQLTGLGRPGVWGDVVELTGTIRRTDPDDGGGLTLRADQLTVRQPARPVDDPLRTPQLVLAVLAALAAIGAGAVRRHASDGRSPRSEAGS